MPVALAPLPRRYAGAPIGATAAILATQLKAKKREEANTPSPTPSPTTARSTGQPKTPSSTDQPKTDQPKTARSTDQPKTNSSTDQPKTNSSTDQPTTVRSTDQPTTVRSTDQPKTARSTDQPRPDGSTDQPTIVLPDGVFIGPPEPCIWVLKTGSQLQVDEVGVVHSVGGDKFSAVLGRGFELSRSALADLSGARHEQLSKAQANAVVYMLQRAQLNPDEKATLALMSSQVNWFDGHDAQIMSLLVASPAPRQSTTGNVGQKYTSFVEFFTEAEWKKMLEENPSSSAILSLIISRVIRLGGRNVCEYSNKLMTSLWLMLCDPSVDPMSFFQKKKQFLYVKREYRRIADKTPRLMMDQRIDTLPSLPDEFATLYPAAHNKAFSTRPGDGPMRCPLNMQRLLEIDNSYRCRGSGPELDFQRGAQSSATSLALAPIEPQSDIRQMLLQSQQQMQQMQAFAINAMQLVAGNRGGAAASGSGGAGNGLLENLEVFSQGARAGGRPSSNRLQLLTPDHHRQQSAPSPHQQRGDLAPPLDQADGHHESSMAPLPQPESAPDHGAIQVTPQRHRDQPAAPGDQPVAPPRVSLKDSVHNAMKMMEEKGLAAKGRKRAFSVSKKPACAAICDAAEDEGEDDAAEDEGDDASDEDDVVTTPPPMKSVMKAARKATPPPMKSAMKAATKGGSGKTKGIDYSDLLSITKSTMKKTTRGAFTSKAYDNTKKRASVAGMSPAKVLAIAREAYAAAASKWDKLKVC
ncbi:unnamed protein product [Prorocentrum cordatum]|uniref:Defective in cullin neddylation protein n=1 Tax=Prorocentrum cordatum TaxID=2364126 RepID=A0ABN9UCY0_9DINO|nr:unnamed protein product [Polarella glacialis]